MGNIKIYCKCYLNKIPLFSWKGCGGYLHADRGIITSPQYPETYGPNLNCSWHVLVQSGLTIAVHFEQPFQIPNGDSSCSQGDYLAVSRASYLFALLSLQTSCKKQMNLLSWDIN